MQLLVQSRPGPNRDDKVNSHTAIPEIEQLHKNAASNIEKVLEVAPHKAAAVRPPTTNHENYPS